MYILYANLGSPTWTILRSSDHEVDQGQNIKHLLTCYDNVNKQHVFFSPATADNYKPSCCTIGISQSNLVRQMEGDVSNETT